MREKSCKTYLNECYVDLDFSRYFYFGVILSCDTINMLSFKIAC